MKYVFFIILLFVSLNAVSQIKKDTTCSSAASQTAYYKCLSKQYLSLDEQLNELYKSLLDMLIKKNLQSAVNTLKKSQQAWVIFRKKFDKIYEDLYQGGTMMPIVVLECDIKTTDDRIIQLNELYNDLNR